MIRVSDYIMQRLSGAGIRHLFQVTGRGALFLNDALAKSTELKAVCLHHEQSCAFAAVSYAEQTGGLGACLVSTGCAATNTVTGVLSAWQDGVPCIFISGQNILRETTQYTGIGLRTFGQQEANIVQIVNSITKYSHMVTRPEEIVEVMNTALNAALSGRKGPVWIDVPLDIQSAMIDIDDVRNSLVAPPVERIEPEDKEILLLVDKLKNAKRPIVLIGKGVSSAGAEEMLKEFIQDWQLPLVFSASAPDTYGAGNYLSIGSVGAMGCSRAGNFAISNADLVLVLGSRLTSLTTGPDFCKFARAAEVLVVDIDPIEHSKSGVRIDQFIKCNLRHFFEKLVNFDPGPLRDEWLKKCIHWKNIFRDVEPSFKSENLVDLYQLADSLSKILPRPSTIVTDSGLAEVILPSNIKFSEEMKCIHPASQGAMGFALPAAIGVQCAISHPVLAVIGDGSFMMNLQELESIRYLKLPIKLIVINNNMYSIIRRRQQDLFRKRTIGTDSSNGVSCPDFKEVADCFGFSYLKVSGINELDAVLEEMFSLSGPVLCEVMGKTDQGYIELGHTRSSAEGKFVRRPLEDQAPFLPRDLFLSEMIIEPIDQ